MTGQAAKFSMSFLFIWYLSHGQYGHVAEVIFVTSSLTDRKRRYPCLGPVNVPVIHRV